MRKMYFLGAHVWFVALWGLLFLPSASWAGGDGRKSDGLSLWYDRPATQWMEALPLGNGRLGAMVYGGTHTERLALNESTMWSGEEDPEQHKYFGHEMLDGLRKLFFAGKIIEGNHIAWDNLVGTPHSFGTHLPIGDLRLDFTYPRGEVEGYRRSLDLTDAVCRVDYEVGGVHYSREYFASNPDKLLVVRLTADKKGSLTFGVSLDLMREAEVKAEYGLLRFDGQALFPMHGKGGVHFEGRIRVLAEKGTVEANGCRIEVRNADAVTLLVDVRTDYKSPDYETLCKEGIERAAAKSYKELKRNHVVDYSRLFSRVELQFEWEDASKLPTDVRRKNALAGKDDPALDALFFQYGRYLTIASSREDSPLPIALQGFFNDNKACTMPWTNDYHLDMNTQQNYWVSNVGNLAECNRPLFDYIADLARYGRKTAEIVYGCKGWTAHTTANVWGYTAPSNCILWGLFPTASSWIATHLWTQYEYTQDRDFLAREAYPLLKGNAEFLLDFMTEDPNTGYWVTGPSVSPENGFNYKGQYCAVSMMPTCDRTLVYEIFSDCIRSSEILGVDRAFADSLRAVMAKLPPYKIGRDGGIQEWAEDYEIANPNHRHTSHLLGFYPFAQYTAGKNPDLAEATRKTMELRLSAEGWEDTEWSRANMICFYARLRDADKAYESVKILEGKLSRDNLMTVSPGGIAGAENDIYAFDGNPGGAAGIAEMLVQQQEGYLEILPCLPHQWKNGSFRGLCIRGGAELDAEWQNEVLQTAALKATADQTLKIKIPEGKSYRLMLNGRKTDAPVDADGCWTVCLKKGDVLNMR